MPSIRASPAHDERAWIFLVFPGFPHVSQWEKRHRVVDVFPDPSMTVRVPCGGACGELIPISASVRGVANWNPSSDHLSFVETLTKTCMAPRCGLAGRVSKVYLQSVRPDAVGDSKRTFETNIINKPVVVSLLAGQQNVSWLGVQPVTTAIRIWVFSRFFVFSADRMSSAMVN